MPNYIHPLQQHHLQRAVKHTQQVKGKQFKQLLSDTKQLTVSKHAQARLKERDIQMNEKKWTEINNKMQEAKQKGVTDAVIILDDVTFVASTKNNTIITAIPKEDTNDQIFTNINGTIVL